MAVQFDVEPQLIREAAKNIDSLAGEYDDAVKQFQGAVNELNGSVYDGEGAKAFKEKTMEFDDDFMKMSSRMKAFAEFLRSAANAYDDTEQAAILRARSLQG